MFNLILHLCRYLTYGGQPVPLGDQLSVVAEAKSFKSAKAVLHDIHNEMALDDEDTKIRVNILESVRLIFLLLTMNPLG